MNLFQQSTGCCSHNYGNFMPLNPTPQNFKNGIPRAKNWRSRSSPDESKLAKIIRLENAENLNAEIPTRDDLLSFVALVKAVKQEQEAACEWVEAFRAAIQIHSRGAEQFEWAQLVSEIGIVIASLALLFNSRMAWYGALLLVVTALMILGTTYLRVSVRLHGAEKSIHDARAHFESTNTKKSGDATDEELINSVEKDRPPLIDP